MPTLPTYFMRTWSRLSEIAPYIGTYLNINALFSQTFVIHEQKCSWKSFDFAQNETTEIVVERFWLMLDKTKQTTKRGHSGDLVDVVVHQPYHGALPQKEARHYGIVFKKLGHFCN